MKILEEEEDDDDKASLDDILRELCLLRCSTCKTSVCSRKSDTSYTKDILKELNLVKNNHHETAPVKTQDESVPVEDAGLESEIETHGINSTTESTEEITSRNEESVSDRDESSLESGEYLLRDGCTSQDCACIKPTRSVSVVYLDSNQRHTLESRESNKVPGCLLKNVSSQTKETSFELKKTGAAGQINSQENFICAIKKSDTSILTSLQCNPDSSYSSGDSFHTLPDNFLNSNPFSSLGYDGESSMSKTCSIRDSTKSRHSIIMDLPYEAGSSNGRNKNQMIDTYEKLLHKIERLKKIASWKMKKRKKKSKYSLQGSNELKQETEDEPPGYLEEQPELKLINNAEVMRCERGVQSDFTLIQKNRGDLNQSDDIAELRKMIDNNDDSSSLRLHSVSPTPEERGDLSTTPATQMSQNGRCCRVKETDNEILTHLKHINKLLEEDSCAGCLVQRENSVVNYQDLRNSKNTSKSSRLVVERKDRRKPDKNKQVKVLWAVTKVTVYPDSCRTYEVMRLSRKRPHKVPSSSDTVFVLLPNNK